MSTTPKPPDDASSGAGDRRRSPRGEIRVPISVRCGDAEFEGSVENLSYAGVMVRTSAELPPIGSQCEVVLRLPAGEVEARGKVVRHETKNGRFAIDLEHVDTNGELLLATLLMAGA